MLTERQEADLHQLLTQAEVAGLQILSHAGGSVTFGPPDLVQQHGALVEALRMYRPHIAGYLDTLARQGDTLVPWLHAYAHYAEEVYASGWEEETRDVPF